MKYCNQTAGFAALALVIASPARGGHDQGVQFTEWAIRVEHLVLWTQTVTPGITPSSIELTAITNPAAIISNGTVTVPVADLDAILGNAIGAPTVSSVPFSIQVFRGQSTVVLSGVMNSPNFLRGPISFTNPTDRNGGTTTVRRHVSSDTEPASRLVSWPTQPVLTLVHMRSMPLSRWRKSRRLGAVVAAIVGSCRACRQWLAVVGHGGFFER